MSARGGGEAFEQLKRLLLQETTEKLDDATARVKKLDARVGDDKKLGAALGDSLVEAFHRAEETRGRELSLAVAPLVVNAIRTEIKNSKDMMVEALYPITGRLVKAAVANAFRELIENLNARLDSMTSANAWRLRFRALITGRSMAEIAMAESEAGRLRRALLLERGSGRVLAIYPRAEADDGENVDLASGMIAAITEFASSVYADKGGELRSLNLGSSEVFLRASPRVIVAAEFGGDLSSHREARLDEAFLSIVERHERDEETCDSEVIGALLNDALSEPAPRSKAPVTVFLLILACLAIWAGWGPATRALRESRINKAYANALLTHERLSHFPLQLDIDHAGKRVVLRGLADNEVEPQAIVEAIKSAAKPYAVTRDVSVIALAAQPEPLRSGEVRAAATLQEAQQQIDRLRSELQAARAVLDSPREKVRRVLENSAVFFSDHENIVDGPRVGAMLDTLAALLKETGVQLRVIGYADDIGTPQLNRTISHQRAEKVIALLVERGVPRERMSIAARSTTDPIAEMMPERLRNRRVTFELPYAGEFDIK